MLYQIFWGWENSGGKFGVVHNATCVPMLLLIQGVQIRLIHFKMWTKQNYSAYLTPAYIVHDRLGSLFIHLSYKIFCIAEEFKKKKQAKMYVSVAVEKCLVTFS